MEKSLRIAVKKDGWLFLIIVFTLLLVALVIWLFNGRIKTLESEMQIPKSSINLPVLLKDKQPFR